MLRRIARILLIAGGAVVLLMALAMTWLKIHETELVFRGARSREHLLSALPADAERVRGFGETPGEPSEAAMYEDSEAAYQELLRRGVPQQRIIVLGHSLGSGPAVFLATRHKAAALVLFGAFTSIPDAAAGQYPYLPVRLARTV
jgi:pimeloyl-ACP methyl ester carboxylesterase